MALGALLPLLAGAIVAKPLISSPNPRIRDGVRAQRPGHAGHPRVKVIAAATTTSSGSALVVEMCAFCTY